MARPSISLTAQLYVWGVVAAAGGLFAYWSQAWPGPLVDERSAALLVLLVLLGAAAAHFPIRVAQTYKLDTITAVQFGSLLFFGPPTAMVVVGLSDLIGLLALRIRKRRGAGAHGRSWKGIAFNVGQLMIATGVAGVVYFSLVPFRVLGEVPAPEQWMQRVENLWAIPLAGAAMFATNSWLVAVIVGLQHRQSPAEVWRATRHREVLHEAGLILLGTIGARTALHDPWVPVVMVLPTWIIYLSTKRYVQLVDQTITAVEAVADIVDQRDRYTFEHSKRVADYAQRIARAMRLSQSEVETIRLAARVHDVGKIGIPNEILHKPGALTSDEWELMRSHPQVGYEILSKFPEYRLGKELVRTHHEHHDGSGYPQRLHARQLKLGAQIIAVADTWDAMTSDRPYRKALSTTDALAELRRVKGVQLNPDVVEALERVLGVAARDASPVPAPRVAVPA